MVLVFLSVFQTIGASLNEHEQANPNPIRAQQRTVNPKTGRKEIVVVNLEEIYPDGDYKTGREYCLEELRAARRGLLHRDWRKRVTTPPILVASNDVVKKSPLPDMDILSPKQQEIPTQKPAAVLSEENAGLPVSMPVFDDQAPALRTESTSKPVKIQIFDDEASSPQKQTGVAKPAKKSRREDRANRTQKIQILEVRAEPQTSRSSIAP
jgi:checkpoint serine/threonine-protein kinase